MKLDQPIHCWGQCTGLQQTACSPTVQGVRRGIGTQFRTMALFAGLLFLTLHNFVRHRVKNKMYYWLSMAHAGKEGCTVGWIVLTSLWRQKFEAVHLRPLVRPKNGSVKNRNCLSIFTIPVSHHVVSHFITLL